MSNHMEKTGLFSDFKPVSPDEWKEKMSLDLKGMSFENLTWKTNGGIEVRPFYTAEDLDKLGYLNTTPGEFPFLRGTQRNSANWEIRQDIKFETAETSNKTALNALNLGATSIGFVIPEEKSISQSEFSLLLKDIYFECININFLNHSNSSELFEFLQTETKAKNIDPVRLTGSIDNDPLGYLTKYGRFANPGINDLSRSAALIKKSASQFPNLRTLGINAEIFHNAGGNIIQELGFSLAMISDYLDIFEREGLKPETIAKSMQLNLAIGPLYFMEIAKIRAARLLFARICKSWGIQDENAMKAWIHCTTSQWNQTIYDPYVNILRSTTESMSAAMAGCDSLTITPFDAAFRSTNRFSERIARNTQIILKEESWLDKVQDPAAGSYFIENITDSIISGSWKLFLEIEELGGYLEAFKAGEIQKRIKESANLRNHNIAQRKEILLGTNQYANPLEHKPEDLDIKIAFSQNEEHTCQLAEPLKIFRGAAAFEMLRLKSEKNPKKVFLLPTGHAVKRKARAGFSSNFFACAGFEITENSGFETLEAGISAALKSKADIVVLCSSDEEYKILAPEAKNKIDKKTILVIAGFPKDSIEELKSKGIQNFIHIKSNLLEELSKYQEMIGM